MKRFLKMMALALSAVLLVSCAACSKGDEGSGDKTDSKAGFSKDSLCIVYEGTKYQVNVKADKVKAALGEPAGTTSQVSCHYSDNGDEYYYDYYFGEGEYAGSAEDYTDVLRVHTVPLKPGEDYVCDFDCYTTKVTTDKGITVGSSFDDVKAAYGDGYTDEGDGFYTYYAGEALPDTPRVMFHVVDNAVEYFSVSAAINI